MSRKEVLTLALLIAILTMNLDTVTPLMNLPVQIAIAMLVGVYYVGALLDKIHRLINSVQK
ncbi:MAG: hypothetical protein IJH75_06540 [Mogibacterium sp.]|nr:hypothetical protein [Mogibacterium sp.]